MMKMIDVMKRLAELDSANPNIVRESTQVGECGMMPEMGLPMVPPAPQHPASINMTAGSGEELGDLLTTIMSLAGVAKGGEEPVGGEPQAQVLEPVGAGETPADNMRSVIDKLNPMGDNDGDGDHDMDDHDMEKDEGYYKDPDGDEDSAADQADQADSERRGREEELGEYDNTPADPNDKNEFDADQFAHQENQPGQGDRMDGDRPKAYADMNEAVTDLFAQYKKFVSEN